MGTEFEKETGISTGRKQMGHRSFDHIRTQDLEQ
jgi:hypothetical protein